MALIVIACEPSRAFAAEAADSPYEQHEDLVYGEVDGVGLLMDVFVPRGDKNGRGIVDVISGAWYSDRGKLDDHRQAQVFHILCRRGYTIFAVRPGSVSRFAALEMLDHLQQGIVWAKRHAPQYGVDAERMGLMGASAGGHLALLAAMAGAEGGPSTGNHTGAAELAPRVRAVAAFFPPTDLTMLRARGGGSRGLLGRLVGDQEIDPPGEEHFDEAIRRISPAHRVTEHAPPVLLIHGDADSLVPLEQSQKMLAALEKARVEARLIVKPGGGHPWPTIHEEVAVVADWFDEKLRESPPSSTPSP